MYKISIIIAAMAIVSMTVAQSVQAQEEALINAITGGFESISVVQDASQIVITITKTPGEEPSTPPLPDNGTVPTDPIIIVPDPSGEGNGTVIIPQPGNGTTPDGGNVTGPDEIPVIIVDPTNNDTIVVDPPTNVTQIDNGTVIVAPPNQTITETPGNVTVIDPPPSNSTGSGEGPAPCGCPIGVDGGAPDIQLPAGENMTSPVISNNTNITVVDQAPDTIQMPPSPTDENQQQAQESNDDGGGSDNNNNGDN